MNIWQFRKKIGPLLNPLTLGEQAVLREEEYEGVVSNIKKYVEMRCITVENVISQLPYKDTRSLVKIGSGALIIADVLGKRIKTIEKNYRTHEHAVLYGATKEVLSDGLREIIEKYNYLARVAFGMANNKVGRNGNLLPLDKMKWLER